MRFFCRSLALTVALVLAATATPAHAQFVQEPVVASEAATAAGPTLDGATAGVRSAPTIESRTSLEAALKQDEPRMGRNVALMIVGGAALITGLIIGDDAGAVIAVSGAIIGLYGLYNFVK